MKIGKSPKLAEFPNYLNTAILIAIALEHCAKNLNWMLIPGLFHATCFVKICCLHHPDRGTFIPAT
jgi:hypothetical protein